MSSSPLSLSTLDVLTLPMDLDRGCSIVKNELFFSFSSRVVGRFKTSEELDSFLLRSADLSYCLFEKRLLRLDARPLDICFLRPGDISLLSSDDGRRCGDDEVDATDSVGDEERT